jgi:hypothetical protein
MSASVRLPFTEAAEAENDDQPLGKCIALGLVDVHAKIAHVP